MLEYRKPHLNYKEQVDLLRSRGLDVGGEAEAVALLRRVGYYRLSAYTYVLRAAASPAELAAGARRSSMFVSGARLEDVRKLYEFDSRLRAVLLEGLQSLEVALRVEIWYTLGKRDRFGHLDPAHLDTPRCLQIPRNPNQTAPTKHGAWLDTYGSLCAKARSEDFVTHFHVKYDGRMPIWVATEVMTFGALTELYELLAGRDSNTIATRWSAGNREVLHGWLLALNILRNHCAHNARIWNRKTVYPPAKPPLNLVPARVHHLRGLDNDRLYFLAALLAHLLRQIDKRTRWPAHFKEAMKKFPPVGGMTPESVMGFPAGWGGLDLWTED